MENFTKKYNASVIDIGSNSVRYMLVADGKILFKKSTVSQMCLGKKDGLLSQESMQRTLDVINDFVKQAKVYNYPIYAFATAGVRNSLNGNEFVEKALKQAGLKIDVLSGEQEAEIALTGVLRGNNGGVIDIGGGSSEIIVKTDDISYSHSLDLGAVVLYNQSEDSLEKAQNILNNRIDEYGNIPKSEFYAVGGTATSLAAVLLNLKTYSDEKVNGFKIDRENLEYALKEISVSCEEICKKYCVDKRRATVLKYGALILKNIMLKADIFKVTVSASDNLEGYLIWKTQNLKK